MSRLTIDISPEQHKSLKALAALEGKTIRQYALERLFPPRMPDPLTAAGGGGRADPNGRPGREKAIEGDGHPHDQAGWAGFSAFLEQRAAQVLEHKVEAGGAPQRKARDLLAGEKDDG